MTIYNATAELPIFLGTSFKPTLIIAAKISAGGSLAIQYKVGNQWVTAETFTADFVREMTCAGMRVKCVVTGTVQYVVG